MICSTLASLWKFQYFQRPIYNPVEHLWWSLYCENSKPLSIFTKKLYRRCSLTRGMSEMITCIKLGKYQEPSVVNYFRKDLHVTCLTGFWIRLCVLLHWKSFVNEATFGAVELIFCERNACRKSFNRDGTVISSFSPSARDSCSEEIFWSQPTIHSPEYHNIMSTKCNH